MKINEAIQFIFVVTLISLFGMQNLTSFINDKQISINISTAVLCKVEVCAMILCQAGDGAVNINKILKRLSTIIPQSNTPIKHYVVKHLTL